jgi:hypothetical protein
MRRNNEIMEHEWDKEERRGDWSRTGKGKPSFEKPDPTNDIGKYRWVSHRPDGTRPRTKKPPPSPPQELVRILYVTRSIGTETGFSLPAYPTLNSRRRCSAREFTTDYYNTTLL